MDGIKEMIGAAHEIIEQADTLGCVYDCDMGPLRAALASLEAREAKKTVPMAMLWDIFSTNGGSREIFCDVADRYGYEVTE